MSLFRSRAALIVPLVLVVVALLQDVVTYKVRQHVHNVYQRAAIILLLNGVGFAIAANFVGPALQKFLARARRESRESGTVALWLFYALAYGLVFYAYVVTEKYGTGALLPASLR